METQPWRYLEWAQRLKSVQEGLTGSTHGKNVQTHQHALLAQPAAAETSTADVVVGVVVPGVPPNAVTSALQALGGAAAPHLLVLHSTTVLTRQVNRRSAAASSL